MEHYFVSFYKWNRCQKKEQKYRVSRLLKYSYHGIVSKERTQLEFSKINISSWWIILSGFDKRKSLSLITYIAGCISYEMAKILKKSGAATGKERRKVKYIAFSPFPSRIHYSHFTTAKKNILPAAPWYTG